MSKMTINLDREEFRAWLQTKAPRKIVGKAQKTTCCPLATFLCEQNELPAAFVTVHYFGAGPIKNLTPAWAARFIGRIDGHPSDSPITAKTALAVLQATAVPA